jgi:hypothetical protein
MRARRRTGAARPVAGATVALSVVLLAGCATRDVPVPSHDEVRAPAFATLPADLADSRQLAALPIRDTAGLLPDARSADGSLLAPALEAMARVEPAPAELVRISIYADDVYLAWRDPTTPGRQVSARYDRSGGLSIFQPRFGEDAAYPPDVVDPAVPARLVAAIERRAPSARVTAVDLRVALSYGFGLAWYVEVTDVRGRFATVFADLDGAIVGVDAQ